MAACSGGSGGVADRCQPASLKSWLLPVVRDWYLFDGLLPAAVDPAAYAGPEELLDALTAPARALGRDRFWSYLSTAQSAQQYFGAGETVGFGMGLVVRGTQLFLGQVIRGSAASDAGFLRGDEILALGETSASLVPVSTLLAQDALGAAFGPAEPGVTRVFQVIPAAGGPPVERSATKRIYSLDPVPSFRVEQRPSLPPAGYVQLRTFVGTADPLLRTAFASFRAAGAADVVVDLRYNGGGLVSTAEILASLLAADRAGQAMYRMQLNPRHAALETTTSFSGLPEAVAASRIVFVTTGATASASELVANVLAPYTSVALVGAPTYGKPVGQLGFQPAGCDALLFLVAFQLTNSAGQGDYFSGLPDASFTGSFCPAADDLAKAQDSSGEASTATALYWLENGTCPAAPLAAGALRAAAAPDRYPAAPQPTPAQVDMPGLF